MLKIPKMTMQERAFGYPYTAPEGAFLLQNGYQLALPDRYDFSGRVAVLSVDPTAPLPSSIVNLAKVLKCR